MGSRKKVIGKKLYTIGLEMSFVLVLGAKYVNRNKGTIKKAFTSRYIAV
jgi:hypothetical protein